MADCEEVFDKEEDTSLEYMEMGKEEVTTFEMAYRHFNNLWIGTQQELVDLLKKETPYDQPQIIDQRLIAVRRTSKLYLQYIRICNNFIKCYEYIPHPQKRRYLKKICDACIGRVLELKHELSSLEKTDFHFLDQMLLNLRMFPNDMNMKIPEYFKEVRTEEEQEKRRVLEELLARKNEEKKESEFVTKQEKFVRMAMVFLQMIQAHERTRQDMAVFNEAQKKYVLKEMKKQKEALKEMPPQKTKREYATIIQRAWRQFIFRKRLNNLYSNELKMLRMEDSEKQENITSVIENDRLDIIKRNEEEYIIAKDRLWQKMLTYDFPILMEELEEKIRTFVHEYHEINGAFPVLPSEEVGGSTAMFQEAAKKKADAENKPAETVEKKEPSKKDKKEKDKKEKDKNKAKKDKKDEKKEEEPPGYSLKPSRYIPAMLELLEEYNKTWKAKECVNFDRFDKKLLEKEVEADIQLSVRQHADENMRIELERLTKALKKDSKKKGKKKGKKGKKGKKKKQEKKEVDLTPDRSLDSLVNELVNEGIIVSYPKVLLHDFLGEYNYSGSIEHFEGDPESYALPCLADIRRVVNEYCILPMGSEAIHAGGAYVKSILLAGPHGSGKKTLVYAICNEIGATMMNLSAENIQGKYPGPEGLEMLTHLVSKVCRLLQPTVIYIKDAESYYWKKRPPYSKLSEPSRLKKALPKLIKRIKNDDRVLVCGTSANPFDADPKALGECYEKIICIFKPDYNCRSYLWREIIKRHRNNADLDVSVLANISDGFTAGQIEIAVQNVLTDRRLVLEKKIPVNPAEFVSALAECVPVYEEEHAAYKAWLLKLNLGSQRVALYEQEKEEAPEEEIPEDDDY
ncbi:Dynein regulatory complex protein 11 [Araneus ventricosus]|uniref:Dynein regulatory complex protein 11 n=1 Tax=Araneus ventricosus TaxID=182803 RepID=A0A4Y2SMN6_ARAVE|nr:Dynein regulatory complex protein 11 [Araneus ventricosus]